MVLVYKEMTSGNLKKGNEKDTKEATHNRKIYHSRDSQREIDELCYVHKHSKKNEKQKKKKSILPIALDSIRLSVILVVCVVLSSGVPMDA